MKSRFKRAKIPSRSKATTRMNCDPLKVEEFDCSKLHPAFAKMGKPARRALVNAGLLTPKQLAKKTRAEVAALHGMGPSSFPTMLKILRAMSLKFRAGR